MSNELKIAEPQDEPINKSRKPTAIDRKILEWLKSGQSIDHVTALNKFKTTMLRDSIWRLIKDGYPIHSMWHYYKTNEGATKKYKIYFIKPPEIKNAGAKTDKELLKGTRSIVETTKDMQKTCQEAKVIQTSIFDQSPANRL